MKKKQIITIIILIVGLVVTVILVQRPQIFKSRADIDISSGFNISDTSGEKINCEGQTCTTDSEEVTIEVTNPDIFLKE